MMYGSSVFFGIRFFLAGFSPQDLPQIKSKIVAEGGDVFDEYHPECTHVVVHNLVYDDPICVIARRDKKTVVTDLWVNDSLALGEPASIGNIMYRPLRELTGIPGAKEFVICLTGYQGFDREDMKMMVRLMGAQISKPLVVNKVTHLICYLFEGEKYELAKKMQVTKIVNHHWLKDCLKAWKILPEEPYSGRSGYEMDMMDAEAKDSEDETEDIGRNHSGISLQNKMGEAHNHTVVGSKVSVPSTLHGISNSSSIDDGKLPKSDLLTESASVKKLDKQPAQGYRAYSPMGAKSDNVIQSVPSIQIRNGHPSTSGNSKNSNNFVAEKSNGLDSNKTPMKTSLPLHFGEDLGNTSGVSSKRLIDSDTGNFSPLSSRKTPKPSSLKTAGKYRKSDGRTEGKLAEKIIDDAPSFNLEINEKVAASDFLGVSSSKRLDDSGSGKHNPKSLSKSSLSLQSAGNLSNLDGNLEKTSADKVITNVFTSNIGPDQGKAASAFETSSSETGLFDEKGSGGLLPQKRTADCSNVSHITPKSQKLTPSASKRIDAAKPRTSVNNSFQRNGDLNPGIQIGDESARPSGGGSSPYVSSSQPNSKNAALSRSLAFEMLQDGEPMNTDAPISPNANSVSTSSGVGNKNGQLQNLQKVGDASPGTDDLEALKSGSPKLNSTDQTGNVASKPPRKKTMARKTLGSRAKLSKKSAGAQSPASSDFRGDSIIHLVVQENKGPAAPSSTIDKIHVPPTEEEPVGFGSESHLKPGDKICDYAETVGVKENLVSRKKGMADKARKNSLPAAKEVTKDADETEGEKSSDRVNEQVASAAANKRRGTLVLNKSKRPVEMEKENDFVCNDRVEMEKENDFVCNDRVEVGRGNDFPYNDQHGNNGLNRSGKLALKNRRGSLKLKKSEGPVEVENENEPVIDGDEGQNNNKDCPGDLSAYSNMPPDNVEVKNKNDPVVINDQGTSKVEKCPGKIAGKKRRDTLHLKKSDGPDEAEKESEPVLDGVQHLSKLAGASGILDRSTEVDKENDSILANNQDTSKGGKRAGKLAGKKRRGTLILNKSEVQANSESKDNQDLDDGEDTSNVEIFTEKLTSISNSTVTESNAARKGGKRTGKPASKKKRGTLVLNKSELQVNEGNKNKLVLDGDEDKSNRGLLTEELNSKSTLTVNDIQLKEVKKQPACFIVSGHRLQRKEFQQLIKRLKGKVCRDTHQWSYQASHFVVPEPIRRTEKFFAAAASGSWILKIDYLTASSQAGKLLPEEPYEWHKSGLTEDGAISLEAPRKWRLLRERTGHGAFYGMRIVIYGECIAPTLDTLKRVVKAGDGTILATSPPYTRILESGVDFAIVSPGMPRVDIWVQEFLRHEIPCVLADYLVEYVCKPGYPLDRHVQYNTHEWAAKSFSKLSRLSEDVVADAATPPDDQVSDDLACQVCGSTDRGEVMLVCGNESGSTGCGIGTHIDCCDPPLENIPEEDWFCPNCTESLE